MGERWFTFVNNGEPQDAGLPGLLRRAHTAMTRRLAPQGFAAHDRSAS